jgi:GntR family galactonate operon transcriptional repressor
MVVRRSLHDQLVELLGTRIVHGHFDATGSLPTEPVLAGELGVSRNALREAIKVLASKGLVEVRPKTGMRVLAREHWNLLDRDVLAWSDSSSLRLSQAFSVVEFRTIIEPKAAGLAAKRASADELATIQDNCSRLEACVATPERIPEVDLAFHGSILLASHNAIIIHLGALIASVMKLQVRTSTTPPGSFEKGLPLHRELADAIARRDAAPAEDASLRLARMPYDDLAEELGVDISKRIA